jgi:hypothetical protein
MWLHARDFISIERNEPRFRLQPSELDQRMGDDDVNSREPCFGRSQRTRRCL